MTETNPLGSLGRKVAKFKDLTRPEAELNANMAKAGLLMPGLEIRIANQEDMSKDQPAGEPGELLIKGPWIIQEYFKNPAADKFHNGYLVTGDIARLDEDGAIIICDRSKDVVKSGGEWISSIDMENKVASMAEIAMAAVVAVPHPRWDERPVVIIVMAQGAKPDGILEKVRTHLSSDFAKFQLPDDVLIWSELPMTSTGKLDKKVMRDRLNKEGYVLPDLRQAKM
jgi:fatty-acyl-CoA synthase